jgi:hypothetical protein
MAMTFGMTDSQCRRFVQRFVGQIVNEPTFPDFCTPTGKWFRAQENCFVASFATKQSGIECEQFQ